MLYVFVCETLAPWALCQSHISASYASFGFLSSLALLLRWSCGIRTRGGGGRFAIEVRGRSGIVGFLGAVEDVVELGDWVAAFDANGHAFVHTKWIVTT